MRASLQYGLVNVECTFKSWISRIRLHQPLEMHKNLACNAGRNGMERNNKDSRDKINPENEDNDFIDYLLDDIIENKDTIFKNRNVLLPGFIPNNPQNRNTQIKFLVDHFKPCFRNEPPSNLLIYGLTGTGKTLITRHVSRKIKERSKKENLPSPFITYINVQMTNTKYRILQKICGDLGVDLPKTGLATDFILETLKDLLIKENRNLVVIIDEIDLLVKSKEKDDLLYLLTRLSEDEPSIKISIIGISNDLRFKSFLGIRVLSSLNAPEIMFHPYTQSELETILEERARLAFKEGVCDDTIIRVIAALGAKEEGDARKTIALLLKAGEVAEQEKATRIHADHIVKARDKLEFDTMANFLVSLPIQYQLVVIGISNAYFHYRCNVNTGSLLSIYHELVRASDTYVSSIGERRLLQILKSLRDHGIIELNVVSKGGHGRSSIAKLCLDRKTVEKVFSRNLTQRKLLNYIPKVNSLDNFLKFKYT
ncbi:MAG: Cdc6/Cdc18 family protein [Candidatus Hodarchaeota archaeon]